MMKLRIRLSIYAILGFSLLILIASFSIYFSFSNWLERNEIKSLKDKTLLAGLFYLEEDEISAAEHQTIREQLRSSISRKDIALFDEKNQMQRGEMEDIDDISTDFLNRVRIGEENTFYTNKYFYNGLFYTDNEGDFVIVTRSLNNDFKYQKQTLLNILVIVFIAGLILMFMFSQLLAKVAYQPIEEIILQIKKKDHQTLNRPIKLKKPYEEIQELVSTYNSFIERLAQTFHIQNELRTPITALLGTLDVAHQKKRSEEEYQKILLQLKKYVSDLQEALDNMMLLSGAKTNFEFKKERIDEIIWKVVEDISIYQKGKIEVKIEITNPDLLEVECNFELLDSAFENILTNALKYSNHQEVLLRIYRDEEGVFVEIKDKGIGIPKDEVDKITENFYRGTNTKDYQGKGVGLSMSKIIFELHHFKLSISSDEYGTTVRVLVNAKISY